MKKIDEPEEELITRKQAEARYGYSKRYLQRRADVIPPVGMRGRAVLVRVADIERYRLGVGRKRQLPGQPSREGLITAEAYQLFERGAGIKEAVVRLKLTREEAKHLYASWCEGELVTLPQSAASAIDSLLEPFGRFIDWEADDRGEQLVALVRQLLAFEREILARPERVLRKVEPPAQRTSHVRLTDTTIERDDEGAQRAGEK